MHRPVGDGGEVGPLGPGRERLAPVCRREHLLELPALLGHHVLERRSRDCDPFRIQHRRAGRERPVAPVPVLDPDAVIGEHDRAVLYPEAYGGKLAREFLHHRPAAQRLGSLRTQYAQIRLHHRGRIAGDDASEFDVVRHRDREIRDPTEAAAVGQRLHVEPGRGRGLAAEGGVDTVGLEHRLEHVARGAVQPLEERALQQRRALRRGGAQGIARERERHDAELAQCRELTLVGLAVLIAVLPDAQLGVDRILHVDATVAVEIVVPQDVEAELALPADQFGDVLDSPVAVAIDGEEPVVP